MISIWHSNTLLLWKGVKYEDQFSQLLYPVCCFTKTLCTKKDDLTLLLRQKREQNHQERNKTNGRS